MEIMRQVGWCLVLSLVLIGGLNVAQGAENAAKPSQSSANAIEQNDLDEEQRARGYGYPMIGAGVFSSNRSVPAARIAGGAAVYLNEERTWMLDLQVSRLFSSEVARGNAPGRLSRLNGVFGLGYGLIPGNLFLRAGAGLSIISGENPEFEGKIKPTYGAGLRWGPASRKSPWFIDLGYDYTGEARSSLSSPAKQSGAIIGCAFGNGVAGAFGAEPEPCELAPEGVAPAVHSVSLSIGYAFW